MTTAVDNDLYRVLDSLHGQVLRAKYRVTEAPDSDVLAVLVGDIVLLAKLVEGEWQAHEAAPGVHLATAGPARLSRRQ